MSKVIVDMGMSLDGFVAGPNAGPHNNLGDGARVFERIDPKDIELEVAMVFDSPEVTHVAYRLGKVRTERATTTETIEQPIGRGARPCTTKRRSRIASPKRRTSATCIGS